MAVMKPTDERSTRVGTSPTAADGPTTELREETDRHRRRLVIRGASALPMLLTLRSGALAAQSCTGVPATALGTGTANTPFFLAAGEGALGTLRYCNEGTTDEKVNGGELASLNYAQNKIKCKETSDPAPNPPETGGYYCSTTDVAIVSSAAFASMDLGGRVY